MKFNCCNRTSGIINEEFHPADEFLEKLNEMFKMENGLLKSNARDGEGVN